MTYVFAGGFWSALRHGVAQVWRIQGVGLAERLSLLVLKVVAITGYCAGKFIAARKLRQRHSPFSVQPTFVGLPPPAGGSSVELRAPPAAARQAGKGRVAIVVPAYIRSERAARLLQRLVHSLARQTMPPEWLIIVDDGSAAGRVAELAETAAGEGSGMVTTLRLARNSGPATARNLGIRAALALGADAICLTDSDCCPDPSWISELLAAQRACPGIVFGNTLADNPSRPVGRFHDRFGTLNGRRAPDGSLLYGCTCNCSLTAAAAASLPFDTDFPAASFEDVELSVRAQKQGVPLTYCRSAVVRHAYDYRVAGLALQFFKYGRYEGLMTAKHKEYLQWLHASKDIPC